MLIPDPHYLRSQLTRYTELRAGRGEAAGEPSLEDVSYTLCVLTGTRHIGEALTVAETLLAAAAVPDPAGTALAA
ncbi:DUF5133 domain-containing protein [Streptomyces sp. LP05-1]|uniref:DUF5133 domain-containing protein n=1 Tax=Streptomyces pyxinae TaxID=2970734 RepID=A0ABT2CDY5_9ACTN|nr:DUF5133 domain-containing protein [Streptomyces sp. LP05-1]MCS0635620.1 DUF5133 domain-containing protein [Streptomyces sp. LP05-1]